MSNRFEDEVQIKITPELTKFVLVTVLCYPDLLAVEYMRRFIEDAGRGEVLGILLSDLSNEGSDRYNFLMRLLGHLQRDLKTRQGLISFTSRYGYDLEARDRYCNALGITEQESHQLRYYIRSFKSHLRTSYKVREDLIGEKALLTAQEIAAYTNRILDNSNLSATVRAFLLTVFVGNCSRDLRIEKM